ncbi:unnamed protein product [Dovyalis caffra]|uniref:Uncharacterized protein n=1 Tax=Dovyalis caffra TaxID=77055 RepID=A0AAV1SN61_9ROSI|nr:unnamed protein product [Dovyalis caffra]
MGNSWASLREDVEGLRVYMKLYTFGAWRRSFRRSQKFRCRTSQVIDLREISRYFSKDFVMLEVGLAKVGFDTCGSKDLVSWNLLAGGYVKRGEMEEA